jgi:hypothetical protein
MATLLDSILRYDAFKPHRPVSKHNVDYVVVVVVVVVLCEEWNVLDPPMYECH